MREIIDGEFPLDGPILRQMKVLGTLLHWKWKNSLEVKSKLKVVITGWRLLLKFWTIDVRRKLRFMVFYAVVINAAISGLEALFFDTIRNTNADRSSCI